MNDPPEAEDDPNVRKRTDDIGEWDLGFMQVDQDLLFKIILVRFMSATPAMLTLDRPPTTSRSSPSSALGARLSLT